MQEQGQINLYKRMKRMGHEQGSMARDGILMDPQEGPHEVPKDAFEGAEGEFDDLDTTM